MISATPLFRRFQSAVPNRHGRGRAADHLARTCHLRGWCSDRRRSADLSGALALHDVNGL